MDKLQCTNKCFLYKFQEYKKNEQKQEQKQQQSEPTLAPNKK